MMAFCLLRTKPPSLLGCLLSHKIYMIEMDFPEVRRIIYKGYGGRQAKHI